MNLSFDFGADSALTYEVALIPDGFFESESVKYDSTSAMKLKATSYGTVKCEARSRIQDRGVILIQIGLQPHQRGGAGDINATV